VKVLPAVEASDLQIRSRPRKTGPQLHAGDILEALRKRLPKDAFSLIALTETDLYPQDDWNFVFGMAKLRQRVGVYSFARYHPGFYSSAYEGDDYDMLILDRSLKIMAHEVGHMFGLEHCIYYECVINGSNSMGETDKSPSHLCPVDLRKLHHSIRFDPKKRYRDLESFYRRQGLTGHAAWTGSRRAVIEAATAPSQ
jgi:archaemetzincin